MEIPYNGRAILTDNFAGLEIVIPSKKNWFATIFIGAWLGGWLIGEVLALGVVTGLLGHIGPPQLFVSFWLIAWTVGGTFAFRGFLWSLIGKEIIIFRGGQVTVDMKGTFFVKSKTYDLNEAKNFRTHDVDDSFGAWGGRRNNLLNPGGNGTIRFDYGMKTIKFAGDIDEAEGKVILSKLRDKKILTEKNF